MNRSKAGLDLLLVPPRVEAALWRRLRFEHEACCREHLFSRYRLFACAIARRRHGKRSRHGAEVGDYQHFAYEGLLQAIDRYDPLRGPPFSAYARRRIVGSIADGASRMSEVGAALNHHRRLETERARSLLDDPAISDPIAKLATLAAGLAIGVMLEETILIDGPDPRADAYQSLAWKEMESLLAKEIDALPERERMIVRQHYQAGISFTQLASILGLTKGRVSQLHAAALKKLRRRLNAYGRP